MEELRALLSRERPGADYWVAYWRLREELTVLLGCERAAIHAIKEGLAEQGQRAA